MATLFDTGIFSVIGLDSEILVGATLGWFVGGTTTPVNTFTTSDLSIPNANPVPAQGDGRFPPIWIGAGAYKYVLKDAADNVLVTRDGYVISAAPPSFDPDLADFLSGDAPLPIDKGGTGSTSAVDAIAAIGGVPTTGGVALTGPIGQEAKGPYVYLAAGALVGGEFWVTAAADPDPRTGNNQFWATYP